MPDRHLKRLNPKQNKKTFNRITSFHDGEATAAKTTGRERIAGIAIMGAAGEIKRSRLK
jgi:hypothetical protein